MRYLEGGEEGMVICRLCSTNENAVYTNKLVVIWMVKFVERVKPFALIFSVYFV